MKTNHQIFRKVGSKRGFSLAEMLVVIAVIGIVAAIAVPFVANATNEASATRYQRNAQSLAALANQAVAAGDLTIPAAESLEEVVDLLLAGVSGGNVFESTVFQLHSLNPEEKAGAMRLLSWEGGVLQYHPAQ
jgi:prepilin-type N-terminal cleavage/methylation domain-containing protein